MHLHRWEPTDDYETMPDHIRHPQDMPHPATYRFWCCSVCGKQKSFYNSPVGLQRRTIVLGIGGAIGIALIAVDGFLHDDITAIGWIGCALIFPWIGVAMTLLAFALMLVFRAIGWALRPVSRQLKRLGRYFGSEATR